MQQGFDLACAEGWARSKDSFRNWCRRNPELLESVYRLRWLDNVSRDNRSPSFERLMWDASQLHLPKLEKIHKEET